MNQFRYANPEAVQQRGAPGANAQAAVKTIPFDYVFQFTLLGQRRNKVQDVVEISTEGVFVALSVGYSLVLDERRTPRTFGPVEESGILFKAFPNRPLAQITLGEIAAGIEKLEADLTLGFRLSPEALGLFASDQPFNKFPPEIANRVFETGRDAAEEASFLYSLDVSGTGREYQSRPIHNIAGLGIANGDRPFRPFAKPLMLEPKSSLRIQIEEISGPPGTLFIVLQGYKMLGTGRIPG